VVASKLPESQNLVYLLGKIGFIASNGKVNRPFFTCFIFTGRDLELVLEWQISYLFLFVIFSHVLPGQWL
jgi:hypothetical protein